MIAVLLFLVGLLIGTVLVIASVALRLRRERDDTQAELVESRLDVEQLRRESANHVASLTLLLEHDAAVSGGEPS